MLRTSGERDAEIHCQKLALDEHAIVAITDRQGRITYVNDKFCKISQYSREELIGQTHRVINSSYHTPDFFRNLWKTISSGQVWRGELRNKAKDGSYYWVDTTIVPFVDEKQRIAQYVSLRSDITRRVQYEEELIASAAQLKISEAAKSEFLATASHELRTPLTIIKEYFGLVLDGLPGQINEQQADCLQTAAHNCDRLATLINDLLDLQKIEHGSERLHRSRCNIVELIDDCRRDFQPHIRKKGIQFHHRTTDTLPPVLADQHKIIRVLVNLIGNAIKFTPESGSIVIQSEIDPANSDFIRVTLTDSGPGLTEEEQAVIFDKFTQVNRTPGPGIKGTGLGLSIAKNLVELHGGTIGVSGKPGEGCAFSFTLPVYTGRQEMAAIVQERFTLRSRASEVPCVVLILARSIGDLLTVERLLKQALRREDDMVCVNEEDLIILVQSQVLHNAVTQFEQRLRDVIRQTVEVETTSAQLTLEVSVLDQIARLEQRLRINASKSSDAALDPTAPVFR